MLVTTAGTFIENLFTLCPVRQLHRKWSVRYNKRTLRAKTTPCSLSCKLPLTQESEICVFYPKMNEKAGLHAWRIDWYSNSCRVFEWVFQNNVNMQCCYLCFLHEVVLQHSGNGEIYFNDEIWSCDQSSNL